MVSSFEAFQARNAARHAANKKKDELATLANGAKSALDIVQTEIIPEQEAKEAARRALSPPPNRLNDTSDEPVGQGEAETEFIEDFSISYLDEDDDTDFDRDEIIERTTVIKTESTPPTPVKFNFEDNVLTKYDNMQYNFRLYMTSETTTHESLAFDDIIVIAETGSTGFNIIDVQMDTIISPSKATKNSFATSVVIKLIEPFGSSLLDYMRNSAGELGVFDHRRVPVWLDLRFKGYTDGFDESYQGGELSRSTIKHGHGDFVSKMLTLR